MQAARLSFKCATDLVSWMRRLRCSELPDGSILDRRPAATRDRDRFGHRLFVTAPCLHEMLWFSRSAWPRASLFGWPQNGAPGSRGGGGRRRWDGYSIGGNHFMHACRRNIDMLYLVMDNRVYGMTKGQPSPTTEGDWDSQIAPGGTGLPSFNPLAVGLAAGANFVARGYVGDPIGLTNLIVEGIQFKGFAFLEVLSPCAIFRPEEIGWKARAHSRKKPPSADRATAIADALNEDELGLGVFFRREQAIDVKREKSTLTLADIERSFEI